MLTVNTLHITLQYPRNNEWPVLSFLKVIDSNTPAKWVQTKLQLPANWQEELLKLAINPKSYGEILGNALFHSELKILIHTALATSATTRLLLVVEPSELKSLHWERLHFPDPTGAWQSFAQNQQLVFSYYSPSSVKRYYPYLLQLNLKVLFFICSPVKDDALGGHAFTAFDTQAIATALEPNLAGVPHKILYQAADTSWSQLQAELNTQAYTLVHFISHGLYVKGNEQSYLILLDEHQRIRAVSAEEFVNKLQVIAGLPHLLFFSSCNTADPTALSSAHGNFAQIVRNKLATPAVVAMADAVTQATANIVSAEFYGHLYKNAFADLALAKAGHKLLETYDFEQRRDRYLPVLYQDLGNSALFGFEPKGLKDLDAKEINNGLTRLEQTLIQRAPKAVEEFETLAKQVQLGEDLEQLEQFCHEVTDISFATLAQNEAEKVLAAYNEECPFPGMRPFKLDLSQQVDYRKYFFGRDALIEQICAKLNEPERAVLAIIGPSGSGKSSLAFAGVLTKLESPNLQIQAFRPYFQTSTGHIEPALPYLQKQLQGLDPNKSILLYIDQFEEVFTAYSKEERQIFLQKLMALPQEYQSLKILLSIRADYSYEYANQERLLKPIISEHFYLEPMKAEELRAAVEQQVDSVGLEFEKGLAHRILSETVMDEPGAMPLLQHLLWLLWQHRRGRHLRVEDYEAIGGVSQAIAKTADELFAKYAAAVNSEIVEQDSREANFSNELFLKRSEFTTQQQVSQSPRATEIQFYLQNIFLRLTRPDTQFNRGLSDQYHDTRQRIPKNSLYPKDINSELIDELLKELADARLVVTYEHEIEIAHEALITHWPKLRDWLKNRQLVEMRQALTENSLRWWEAKASGQKKLAECLKHTGSEIILIDRQEAAKALFLNSIEVDYLQACRKRDYQVEKNKKNVYRFAMVMVVLFIVNSVVSFFALQQKNKVDNQLAMQQFQKGMELLKSSDSKAGEAEHYFAKALDVVVDKKLRGSIEYAYADLRRANLNPSQAIYQNSEVKGTSLFAKDTRLLAWGENTVQVWNIQTGEPITKPLFHEQVLGANLFADDKQILSWGRNRTAQVWDVATGALKATLNHSAIVQGARVFVDNTKLITWAEDRSIRIWNLNTEGLISKMPKIEGDIKGVTLFANEAKVLSWTGESMQIWDVQTGAAIGLPMQHNKLMDVFIFIDQKQALTWSEDGLIQRWNLETQSTIGKPLSHTNAIAGAQVIAEEKRLVIWKSDGSVNIMDLVSGALLDITFHHESIKGASVFAGDSRLLTWGSDGVPRIWDLNTGELVVQLVGHKKSINGGSVFSNQQQVITWGDDGRLNFWRIENKAPSVRAVLKHQKAIREIKSFANDSLLLTWSNDGVVKVWDAKTGQTIGQPMHHLGNFSGPSLLHKDTQLLTWGEDKQAQIWDVKTGQALLTLSHPEPVWDAKAFANETRVLTWDAKSTLRVWNAQTGQLLKETVVTNDTLLKGILLSDQGHLLLWFWTESAQVWDAEAGVKLGLPLRQADIRGALSLSNGEQVLTWSLDGRAQLWKVSSGEKLDEALMHKGAVRGVRLLKNETHLLTWGEDGIAKIWEISTAKLKLISELRHEQALKGATPIRNETQILIWGEDDTVRIWDAQSGAPSSQVFRPSEEVRNATMLADESLVYIQCKTRAYIWDTQTNTLLAQVRNANENLSGILSLKSRGDLLVWGGDSARIWTPPQTENKAKLLNEFKQTIASSSYMDAAGDVVFLNEQQLARCKSIYTPYQECNDSDSAHCAVRRIWWILERFFYQGPEVEDCMS